MKLQCQLLMPSESASLRCCLVNILIVRFCLMAYPLQSPIPFFRLINYCGKSF